MWIIIGCIAWAVCGILMWVLHMRDYETISLMMDVIIMLPLCIMIGPLGLIWDTEIPNPFYKYKK